MKPAQPLQRIQVSHATAVPPQEAHTALEEQEPQKVHADLQPPHPLVINNPDRHRIKIINI